MVRVKIKKVIGSAGEHREPLQNAKIKFKKKGLGHGTLNDGSAFMQGENLPR